jgi:CRP-like cAMP-binding protein
MGSFSIFYAAQAAYLLTLVSFAMRNVVWLRVFALLSSGAAIYYALHAASEPLWIPILWNCAFVAVNCVHLALSRWRARAVALDPLEEFLAKTVLMNFPPAEVRTFAALGAEGALPTGAQLIRHNTEIKHLFCILKGRVDVMMEGKKVAELGPGRFVGEMSLLTRSRTRADVMVASDLKLLVWTHESIEQWVDGEAARLGYLQTALGTQVVEELLRQQSAKQQELKAVAE